MHRDALAVEVVVAGDIGAGHLEERADIVGAHAVAGFLDARPKDTHIDIIGITL